MKRNEEQQQLENPLQKQPLQQQPLQRLNETGWILVESDEEENFEIWR